jgi:signal transduction histidine kinase
VRDITRRKEYERMRDDFVSTVSHELRTPLSAVMGWLETILSEKPGALNPVQKRYLSISYDSSLRLNKLIEDLLTVSRIQRGTMRLTNEEFDPTDVVSTVRQVTENIAKAKEIEVDYQHTLPSSIRCMGDSYRVEQVLSNFLTNAIKFSEAGMTIRVLSQQEENYWHVRVIDNGFGIPQAELSDVFQRFYRASNARTAQIQGSGLGLYVCQSIIEGHKGQIGIESVEGVGTTAWFSLPILT